MPDPTDDRKTLVLRAESPAATARLAVSLGDRLRAGDTLLLSGPIGAGKSHFCRALIQGRLSRLGRHEEVPSPSFTLVQVYDLGEDELWHADLYRLRGPDDVHELGLDDAFGNRICLVEWPDRLGEGAPSRALQLDFAYGPRDEDRDITASWSAPEWCDRLAGWAGTVADG